MAVKDRLTQLVGPLVEELGFEFVGLEYSSNPKNPVLRVYIDRPVRGPAPADGITLDDCEQVSREISALLDVEDPIRGHYELEVSSPGLDRPLFTPEQYQRFRGQEAEILLRRPLEGRRKFRGRLLEVADDQVLVDVDGEPRRLPFAEIERARLLPDFEALMKASRH